MKVSSRGRYAIKILSELALHNPDEPLSLADMAARQQISRKYAEQVVLRLMQAGLIVSVRGPSGGYRLARDAEMISAAEILKCTEGSIELAGWISEPEADLSHAGFWKGLNRSLEDYLSGITLRDLAKTQSEAMTEDELNLVLCTAPDKK